MSHSNQPPGLPDVVDEAGDTASWVPLAGLALVVAVALLIAMRQTFGLGAPDQPKAAQTADAGTAHEAPDAEDAPKPAEAP